MHILNFIVWIVKCPKWVLRPHS